MVVLDLSASVSDLPRVASTLSRLSREDEPTGLVVFSSGAYEALPPGTPPSELARLVRFFTPLRESGEVYPRNPWDVAEFRGGTNIAAGLEAARYALRREGIKGGSILLMSDLDSAGDTERLGGVIVSLRRDGVDLRIVPLGALPQHQAFFERILGQTAFLAEATPDTPVSTSAEQRLGGILPWGFLLFATLVVVALAVNERLLSRLEVRP